MQNPEPLRDLCPGMLLNISEQEVPFCAGWYNHIKITSQM